MIQLPFPNPFVSVWSAGLTAHLRAHPDGPDLLPTVLLPGVTDSYTPPKPVPLPLMRPVAESAAPKKRSTKQKVATATRFEAVVLGGLYTRSGDASHVIFLPAEVVAADPAYRATRHRLLSFWTLESLNYQLGCDIVNARLQGRQDVAQRCGQTILALESWLAGCGRGLFVVHL